MSLSVLLHAFWLQYNLSNGWAQIPQPPDLLVVNQFWTDYIFRDMWQLQGMTHWSLEPHCKPNNGMIVTGVFYLKKEDDPNIYCNNLSFQLFPLY